MSTTWMVVEDEPDLYDTLLTLFEIWSIDGVAFTNGSDAIRWVEDVDNGKTAETVLPELAILDIRLPGASGPEIGKKLRASPLLRDVAIVLITAHRLTPLEERRAIAMAGADALIYKPLPAPADFRKALQAALIHRQNVGS